MSPGSLDMRTILRVMATLVVVAGCCTGLYFWFDQYRQPIVRQVVNEPLYTVGSVEYSKALKEGKRVIEFGPLPGSAFYAGGLAFKQPEEALVWLKSSGRYEEGWRVYELSGDFAMDTHLVRGLPFTNKTLLVNREVPLRP